MTTRDILVWTIVLVVVILLAKIIWTTPLITSVRETFANGGSSSGSNIINSLTLCPPGSKMYMYEGAAYCCSGTVNTDANTPSESCVLSGILRTNNIFCSLGPTVDGVPNCIETRAGFLQAEGESLCPTSMPNYVQAIGASTGTGRCCAGPGNQGLTDCNSTAAGSYCDVSSGQNVFQMSSSSCNYMVFQQSVGACPSGYTAQSIGGAAALSGLTLPGCSDGSAVCYSPAVINRLNELGYNTSSLKSCQILQNGTA